MISLSLAGQLQLPPSGANQKSVTKQYMGAHAYVKIIYNSPDVTDNQGQSRKGQIWGNLVPYGLTNLNFGFSSEANPSPWRAGANENTVIYFSHDVKVQGKDIKAGSYGLHFIPAETGPWTMILSNNSGAWGSYYYDPAEDAVRAEVTPEKNNFHEWLTYEFTDRQEDQCTAALMWENLSIPFTIKLNDAKDIYVNHLKGEMQNSAGFNWVFRNAAATYCLNNDVNLEEAYQWSQVASSNSFQGNENITTLQTKAGLEMKLGMMDKAMATFEQAAKHPSSNVLQVHALGRQLIALDQADLALKVFKLNVEKHGDVWPVNVGLARGYSAVGQYDKAMEYAKIALARAPDKLNKDGLTAAIEQLKQKQDIN